MKRLSTLLLALLAPTLLLAGNIFVAPTGNDTADGSKEHPLRTPHAALKLAREWRRTADPRTEGGITIHFEAGRYTLDRALYLRPEDSGTKLSPTTLRAAEGAEGKVFIVGSLPLKNWTREGNLWVTEAPKEHGRPIYARQLWGFGGKIHRANLFGEGKMERMIAFDKEHRTITIPKPTLEGLDKAEGVEMLVHQRWATAILRIKEMRYEGDKAIVSFLEPESYLEFAHPWPQPVIGEERGNSSYTLLNAREMLDTDYEWWQDGATGKIYLYAADPAINPNTTTVYIPTEERLMTIEGAPKKAVEHILFHGLTFADTAWNRPSKEGHVTLQGGFPFIDGYKLYEKEGFPWDRGLENQAWLVRPDAAVSVRNARHIRFEQCSFVALGATGLDLATNVHHSKVVGCTFRNIGGTALLAGSFGEGPTEVHIPYNLIGEEEGFCSFLTIEGNTITNATREDWGAVGIGCGYVHDVEIVRNTVSQVNYSAIAVGWGWTKHKTGMARNRIAYNTVRDYARQLYDTGGIYTLSNQPKSVIEYNTIYAPVDAPYATNYRAFCIYLDAATDGYTIRDNWCEIPDSFGFNNPGKRIRFVGENSPKAVKN
ncbi:MAG: right-handed parallel beta-helix repeat-containing protein [Alistipes sp.]|nr:right-handed parallel beta-helix repeat-containing protein [Alistipes sp.]